MWEWSLTLEDHRLCTVELLSDHVHWFVSTCLCDSTEAWWNLDFPVVQEQIPYNCLKWQAAVNCFNEPHVLLSITFVKSPRKKSAKECVFKLAADSHVCCQVSNLIFTEKDRHTRWSLLCVGVVINTLLDDVLVTCYCWMTVVALEAKWNAKSRITGYRYSNVWLHV